MPEFIWLVFILGAPCLIPWMWFAHFLAYPFPDGGPRWVGWYIYYTIRHDLEPEAP